MNDPERSPAAGPAPGPPAIAGVGIMASGLTIEGPLGTVLSNATFAVQPGQLAAITGAGGSGRTSLLLAVAGRMKPVKGELSVGGNPLPEAAAAVRELVAVARAGDVVSLSRWWRVHETISHRALMRGRRIEPDETQLAFDRLGLDLDPLSFVRELEPPRTILLEIALASLEERPVIVVDDVDIGVMAEGKEWIWRGLRALRDTGVTVLASTADATPAMGLADQAIVLAPPGVEM